MCAAAAGSYDRVVVAPAILGPGTLEVAHLKQRQSQIDVRAGMLRSGSNDDLEVRDPSLELTPFDEQTAEKEVDINSLVGLCAVPSQDRAVAPLSLGQAAGVMMLIPARDDGFAAHARAVWCIRRVNRSA